MPVSNYTNIQYIDSRKTTAYLTLGKQMLEILSDRLSPTQTLIILCIGTDRATGDCLGPLVGEHLTSRLSFSKNHIPCKIYGTLENPVHAINLEETIGQIYATYTNPYIIAIDAALGIQNHIGYATIAPSSILPGKGVQKKLPAIGDLSITGIVNLSGFTGSALLQSTRLCTVMKLSKMIAGGICYALRCYQQSDYLDSPL